MTEEIRGTSPLIVGLAKTGIAAAGFLSGLGCKIMISEKRQMNEIKDALDKIRGLDICLETGGHREEAFLNADWILVSPGVPMRMPVLENARNKGIPILSDIELAFRLTKTPIIAITGTNGKTTTTTLLGEILRGYGKRVFVGGNIGNPILDAFVKDEDYDFLVVEVSSFQLEGVTRFAPHIAILLNLTPDHLDRYRDMDEYRDAKSRIIEKQNPGDFAILNAGDPWVSTLADICKSRVYRFNTEIPLSPGAGLKTGHIFIRDYERLLDLGSIKEMGLQGGHNLENIMAAAIAAYLAGVPEGFIVKGLREFKGLPHRIERVRDLNGVHFINDSKGTNVGAVIKALESIDPPIILIAGGQDKGSDFDLLAGPVKEKVKALFLIGEAKEKIARALSPYTQVIISDDLRSAVVDAYDMASSGDTILLSPGCASFDMFKDYKDRGSKFRDIVMEIDHA